MPNPLKIGDTAPDFTLPGVITKPDVQRLDVKLSDYRGRKNVVLAFHHFAFTATWDKQIPSYEAQRAEFEGTNSQVLALSCDPVQSKQAWGKSLGGISYPLVADYWPHGAVAQQYGVFNEKLGRPDRTIFVVDKQGIIRWAKVYDSGIQPDNGELLAELRKLG
jgi:alkyl hydroperoxide reductase subunit AhpC